MNEQGRLTICGMDTLIRIDEGEAVATCSNCVFNGIEAKLIVCPYRSLVKEEIK